jgi:DnaJ family protein C protein 2
MITLFVGAPTALALIQRKLIPAGAAYLEHVRRAVKNLSFEEHDAHLAEEEARQAALSGGTGVEDDLGVGDEEEDPALLSLDPKEWKVRLVLMLALIRITCSFKLEQKQDHYAVLGLSHLRYLATDAQIKIARVSLFFFLIH